MKFAAIQNGSLAALPVSDVSIKDVQFSYETMLMWSDAERAAYGIYPIVDDAIPAGKVATSSTLEKVGNVVQQHWKLSDAPPPPVPLSLTPVQGRLMLESIGKLSAVKAMVAAADEPTQIWFEYATVWERNNPVLIGMGTALGMSSDDIDNLFIAAVQ